MKRALLFLLVLSPSVARADTCETLGLYAFALVGCPQAELGVDTRTPLCEQPQWRHLSHMDHRCYRPVPFDWSKPCTAWDCPPPYDRVYREPITAIERVEHGTREEVDWNYRACRQTLGKALQKLRRRR